MKRKITIGIMIFVFILMSLNLVNATYGVSYPKPYLELEEGNEGRFQFAIINSPAVSPMSCNIILDQTSPLLVEMDIDNNIVVDINSKKILYGTVSVPEGLSVGEYAETFCVECMPSVQGQVEGEQGASVVGKYCKIPVEVRVVGETTRENLKVPQKPKPAIPDYSVIFVIIILVLAILAIMKYSRKQNGVSLPSLNKKRKRK